MKQITVRGMSCAHCQNAVKSALEDIGLENVSVDLETGVAVFEETEVLETVVREAVDDAGFEVANFA